MLIDTQSRHLKDDWTMDGVQIELNNINRKLYLMPMRRSLSFVNKISSTRGRGQQKQKQIKRFFNDFF